MSWIKRFLARFRRMPYGAMTPAQRRTYHGRICKETAVKLWL